jgi:hypothetical protein
MFESIFDQYGSNAFLSKKIIVLGKSRHFGILPDPNPSLAFNRINTNPDPGTFLDSF